MIKMISPSLMCADFFKLGETLRCFEEKGIEYLHIDIMDGLFVPNFTLGADFCRQVKKNCTIPLDIHLMITDPEAKLDWFPIGEGDLVSIHAESTRHIHRALDKVRQMGGRPLLALNPATPLSVLEYVLDEIDGVLIMTVNPGFAGQKMVGSALRKIRDARAYLDANGMANGMTGTANGMANAILEVDGNVSFENARRMSEAGANLFVAGTSSVFAPGDPLTAQIDRMRDAVRIRDTVRTRDTVHMRDAVRTRDTVREKDTGSTCDARSPHCDTVRDKES